MTQQEAKEIAIKKGYNVQAPSGTDLYGNYCFRYKVDGVEYRDIAFQPSVCVRQNGDTVIMPQ